jgi:formiminotetrahydrofolate cyclodeaminase
MAPVAQATIQSGMTTFAEYLDQIAAKTPTPGGGAVASGVGAMSAALAGMVVAYSIGKKSLAAHEGFLAEAQKRLARARTLMLDLAKEDEAAYGLVNELMRLPAGDARREREMPAAVAAAVAVPMAVAAGAVDLLRLYVELAGKTNPMLRSDLGIAAELALATAAGSLWNVRINAGELPEAARVKAMGQAEALVAEGGRLRGVVAGNCGGGA